MAETIQVQVDFQGNIGNLSGAINQIQKQLNSLKLNDNLKNQFQGNIDNIKKSLEGLTSLTSKGFLTDKEAKTAQKYVETITSSFGKMERTAASDKFTEALKSQTKEFQNLQLVTKAYDKYKSQIEKRDKDKESLINENTNLKKSEGIAKQLDEEIKKIQEAKTKYDSLVESWNKDSKHKTQFGNIEDFTKLSGGSRNAKGYNEIEKIVEEYAKALKQKQELESKLFTPISEGKKGYVNSINSTITKNTQTLNGLMTNDQILNEVIKQFQSQGSYDWDKILQSKNFQEAIDQLNQQATTGAQNLAANFNSSLSNIGLESNNLAKTVYETTDALQQLSLQQNDVDQLTRRLTYFFSLSNGFRLITRAVRSAISTVKELDKAMTDIAVVTNYSVDDMWKQLDKYTEQANKMGVATKDVYESATLFYEQGLNSNQVEQLSEATLKMARIAGLDASEATDRMTNALRGFNMELDKVNADKVADVYSSLAASSASNVDEISTAMTKVASLASNAGMEFETTSAFLSQIIETTRESAETAGTALKTVVARFQEMKKAPSEIEEVDGEVVDANNIEKALRSVGVALRDSTGQFRDLDDVFLELASKWDSLDTNTQRYIATVAAGSRQQSRFIAMMSDYERTMELVDIATNSAGASDSQYEKTLDSLESKLNQLTNAWNQFTMGIAQSSTIKVGVDALKGLLNIINGISEQFGQSGGILKLAFGVAGFSLGKSLLIPITRNLVNSFKDFGDQSGTSFIKSFSKKITTSVDKNGNTKTGIRGWGNNIIGKNQRGFDFSNDKTFQNYENNINNYKNELQNLDEEINKVNASQQDSYGAINKQGIFVTTTKKEYLDQLDKEKTALQNNLKLTKQQQEEYQKTIQAKQTWQNKATQIQGWGTAALGVSMLFGLGGNIVEKLGLEGLSENLGSISTAATAAATALMLLPPILSTIGITSTAAMGVIGIIIMAVAALGAGIAILMQRTETAEEKVNSITEMCQTASTAAQDAKKSYDELLSARDTQNNLISELQQLSEGTDAFNEKLLEANSNILSLIEKYPELTSSLSFDENGLMSIDSSILENLTQKQLKSQEKLTQTSLYQQYIKNQGETGLYTDNSIWEAAGSGISGLFKKDYDTGYFDYKNSSEYFKNGGSSDFLTFFVDNIGDQIASDGIAGLFSAVLTPFLSSEYQIAEKAIYGYEDWLKEKGYEDDEERKEKYTQYLDEKATKELEEYKATSQQQLKNLIAQNSDFTTGNNNLDDFLYNTAAQNINKKNIEAIENGTFESDYDKVQDIVSNTIDNIDSKITDSYGIKHDLSDIKGSDLDDIYYKVYGTDADASISDEKERELIASQLSLETQKADWEEEMSKIMADYNQLSDEAKKVVENVGKYTRSEIEKSFNKNDKEKATYDYIKEYYNDQYAGFVKTYGALNNDFSSTQGIFQYDLAADEWNTLTNFATDLSKIFNDTLSVDLTNILAEALENNEGDSLANFIQDKLDTSSIITTVKDITDEMKGLSENSKYYNQLNSMLTSISSNTTSIDYFNALTSSSGWSDIVEKASEFYKTNEKIDANNIKEIADEVSILSDELDIGAINAGALADILESINMGNIGIDEVTDSLINALNTANRLKSSLSDAYDFIDNLDLGRSQDEIGQKMGEVSNTIVSLVKKGKLLDDNLLEGMEMFYGESWIKQYRLDLDKYGSSWVKNHYKDEFNAVGAMAENEDASGWWKYMTTKSDSSTRKDLKERGFSWNDKEGLKIDTEKIGSLDEALHSLTQALPDIDSELLNALLNEALSAPNGKGEDYLADFQNEDTKWAIRDLLAEIKEGTEVRQRGENGDYEYDENTGKIKTTTKEDSKGFLSEKEFQVFYEQNKQNLAGAYDEENKEYLDWKTWGENAATGMYNEVAEAAGQDAADIEALGQASQNLIQTFESFADLLKQLKDGDKLSEENAERLQEEINKTLNEEKTAYDLTSLTNVIDTYTDSANPELDAIQYAIEEGKNIIYQYKDKFGNNQTVDYNKGGYEDAEAFLAAIQQAQYEAGNEYASEISQIGTTLTDIYSALLKLTPEGQKEEQRQEKEKDITDKLENGKTVRRSDIKKATELGSTSVTVEGLTIPITGQLASITYDKKSKKATTVDITGKITNFELDGDAKDFQIDGAKVKTTDKNGKEATGKVISDKNNSVDEIVEKVNNLSEGETAIIDVTDEDTANEVKGKIEEASQDQECTIWVRYKLGNSIASFLLGGSQGVLGSGIGAAFGSGIAYASGNYSSKNGSTLVGELGQEMVVDPHSGRWYTVGDTGAEFTDLPKDAIVFNHKQTEGLLKYGSISNRGQAQASGNAKLYGGGWDIKAGTSGTSKEKDDSDDEAWENNFDRFYNLLQHIEQLNLEQTRLQRQMESYQRIAERSGNYKQLTDTYNDMIKNSQAQITKLQSTVNSNKSLYVGKQWEMQKYLADNSDLSQYGTYDYKTGEVTIDWDKINAVTDKDQGEKIEKYINKLEDIQGQINDAEDAINDSKDELADLQEDLEDFADDYKESYLDFEERVVQALVDARQKEIDDLTELYDTQSDNDSKILDGIQRVVDEQRKLRDLQDARDDIEEKQNRLALLMRDTSGANDLEIKALQEEISDAQESYTDSLVDNAIDEISQANEEASEQRNHQIELMQQMLEYDQEAGAFNQIALELIESAFDSQNETIDLNSALVGLLMSTEGFEGMSEAARTDWLNTLNEEFTAAQLGQDFWNEKFTDLTNTFETEIESVRKVLESIADTTLAQEGKDDYEKWKKEQEAKAAAAAASYSGGSGGSSSTDYSNFAYKYTDASGKTRYTNVYSKISSGSSVTYQKNKTSWTKMATGGYTGDWQGDSGKLAVLHKKELVLDAADTKNFLMLKDVLRDMELTNSDTINGDTYYDVHIDVDKLTSDYDVEDVADKVKEMIAKDASYRNNNTINLKR